MAKRSIMHAEINADMLPEQHGGNLSGLTQRYPDAPRPLIDLSTGINPYPYPLSLKEEWTHQLPDVIAMAEAQRAAAQYYNVNEIVLAPGMQPLIFALACLRLKEHGRSRIVIVSPTYAEHARVWEDAGHEIIPATIEAVEGDVVILANPNNPDGRQVQPQRLLAMAESLAARNGWLIIDESFTDLLPQLSMAAYVTKRPNIAVLRSCGKFFGVAGLRISGAAAPAEWMPWLRIALGPWPISTIACHILPQMLKDTAWIDSTRRKLAEESAAWRNILAQYFTVIGHTPLFTLIETPEAERWHDYLASRGILIRRFATQPNWLRFGLPMQSRIERLRTALCR
ncbi:MAG: pyridoxal phosphate-dependent class II aminotransferase [Pseudomonadota bacterium]|nr:pyridoxal phosphate-dependent class II aminotransferase [Pseudomonadota bacterium]